MWNTDNADLNGFFFQRLQSFAIGMRFDFTQRDFFSYQLQFSVAVFRNHMNHRLRLKTKLYNRDAFRLRST